MNLAHNSAFTVQALTAAINNIAPTPTQIRELGIFEPNFGTKTTAMVEWKNGALTIVKNQERGRLDGEPVDEADRKVEYFAATHLPVFETILAEDYQGVRAFGKDNLTNIKDVVTEYQANAKFKIEMTREHLMLGALQGKILDKDGSVIHDLYAKFGLGKQKTVSWELTKATTKVGEKMDKTLSDLRKEFKGALVTGWVALCSPEFLTALKYHDSITPIYNRYRDGATYRESNGVNPIELEYNGIKFIEYTGAFGKTGAKIEAGKAILLPVGRKLYTEYFAPADISAAVNTKALPYYTTLDKFGGEHDMGYTIRSQSNPLPIALRPDLIVTLTA
ncbi:major capsid protein [Kingella negevensis]|uniref:major capsid protein n=1 Tax=Kingella negevensis TaxID=1522312 RepID=UPI0025432055|nr:major capsid protein [Kingella negevensis]WII93185.1 major capsid protein [Kingella negevensis]